jgi:hypothetical protein
VMNYAESHNGLVEARREGMGDIYLYPE